jgi:hypothetical protein
MQRARGVIGYANDLHVRRLRGVANRIAFLLLDAPGGSSTEAPISLVQHRRMSCMHREHATSHVGQYGRRRTKLDNRLRTLKVGAPPPGANESRMKLDRRFCIAPMMECPSCRKITLNINCL